MVATGATVYFLMEPHKILVATVATKMPSRSALHTLKTSGHSSKWCPIEKWMLSSSWKKCKSHDCLYNKYSKSYKDKYIKINYWKKIGEKFDMSAADAEKKFENVKPQTDRVKYEPSGGRQRRRWQQCQWTRRDKQKTKIQWQRRSYGNIVSLPLLKTKVLCQTCFSTTVGIVATGAIILKPGFRNQRLSEQLATSRNPNWDQK